MSGWIGAIMLAGAVLLALRALQRRRRAASAGYAPPSSHPSLASLAQAVPPIIYGALALAGAAMTAGFVASGGGGFSVFDLLGFLALLVGFALDFGTQLHCRPARDGVSRQ